jgi:flavodoxin
MKKITIIYHSRTGNTKSMAKAVKEGAQQSGAKVILKRAQNSTAQDVLNCDAVIFGSPNYFSYMAGSIQNILEECFIELKDKDIIKPYAVFASAGTQGGKAPASHIERICDEFGERFGKFKFKKSAEAVITEKTSSSGKPSKEVLKKCRELGEKISSLN